LTIERLAIERLAIERLAAERLAAERNEKSLPTRRLVGRLSLV
jgi:hypothetical protein